jgi:hypothetical protein
MGSRPLQIMSALVVRNDGKTRPGQSQSMIWSLSLMVWRCFVLPGVIDTLTFFSPQSTLMVEDLPTLG